MRFPIPHIVAGSLLLLAACQNPKRRWEPSPAAGAGAAPTVTNNCDSRDRNATLTGRVLRSSVRTTSSRNACPINAGVGRANGRSSPGAPRR